MYIHIEMITIGRQFDIYIIFYCYLFLFLVRTPKTYYSVHFQVGYNFINFCLLLHIGSLDSSYITASLFPWPSSLYFFPFYTTRNHQLLSISMHFFLDFTFKWHYAMILFLCLISLSTTFSRLIHVAILSIAFGQLS